MPANYNGNADHESDTRPLRQDDSAEPTADLPPDPRTGSPSTAAAGLPKRIGRYHIKSVIATGGMGTVYEATQERPRRTVALKVMNRGVASRTALRRFEHESQLLARLRHPAIAQVYEAGTHNDVSGPVPYFAMEYIPDARSITRYASEKKLGTRERLRLFITVCEAVHHGHQKGIIHRDLKPGNLLVDASGHVKIIDFGVARSTDADMAVTTLQTAFGELVGTLKYMSPEQCEADPDDIDTRSDVYALGVVLYELLSGNFPYDLATMPPFEVPRVIREVPPIHLSSVDRTLRGDVETIIEKALEKDRDRRYPSALALADDIKRYLNDEPILARPVSVAYQLKKFFWRRKVPLAVATLLVIALGFAMFSQMTKTREAARAAAAARASADMVIRRFFTAPLADARRDEAARALADCDRAIALDPGFASLYALRAKLLQTRQSYTAAWKACNRALELDPTDSLALRTKARLHLRRGEFDDALECYNDGIRGTEGLAEDFHNRARLHRLCGEYDLALKDHDQAVLLEPDAAVCYVTRGITRRFAGNIDGAIEDWSRAAALKPEKWGVQCRQWIWETRMLRDGPGDREAAEAALSAAEREAEDPLEKTVLAVWRGNADPDEAIALATSDSLRCCVYYYLGVQALVEGRRAEATRLLRQSYDTGAYRLLEHDLAGWHLERIGPVG